MVDYQPGNTTSIFLNLRVADIQACYQEWKAKGAEFVTPPIDRGAEIRCYLRDPDGYLIEVGQSTGLLHGKLAAKRPRGSSWLSSATGRAAPASTPPSANLRWCKLSWGMSKVNRGRSVKDQVGQAPSKGQQRRSGTLACCSVMRVPLPTALVELATAPGCCSSSWSCGHQLPAECVMVRGRGRDVSSTFSVDGRAVRGRGAAAAGRLPP